MDAKRKYELPETQAFLMSPSKDNEAGDPRHSVATIVVAARILLRTCGCIVQIISNSLYKAEEILLEIKLIEFFPILILN